METHSPSYAATVAHRLTTVLLVLSLVYVVALTVEAIAGTRDDVMFEATAPVDDDLLPKGVYETSDQRTGFAITSPTNREQRLAFAIDLLALLLWIAVLWFMRGIVRSVRNGDPFTGPNVRRLRAIAALLIVGVLAAQFGQTALQDELLEPYSRARDALDKPGLRPPDRDFPEFALLCGLGLFVLAQVFAHGVRLRDDVAATI